MSRTVLISILEELEEVTGHDPLVKVVSNHNFTTYIFDRATHIGYHDAVEYARELLRAAKAEQEAAIQHPQYAEEFAASSI